MTEISLTKMIVVTAEVAGTTLSEAAAEMMAMELSAYDRTQILGALKRCRRELKGRLTMGAVLDRIEDGRPGSDEAFAMLPTSESQTVVWTDEMAAAANFRDMATDTVTQRLAFREAYTKAVSRARETNTPNRWWASLGHDAKGREAPIAAAVVAGRLPLETAHSHGLMLDITKTPAINLVPSAEGRARIAKLVAGIGVKA
jgi:hypothetical protein